MADTPAQEGPPKPTRECQALVYEVTSQHWTHSEQIRWQLLYNFLMAATILMLAWAAVFASSAARGLRVIASVTLCLGGLLLSIAWLGAALRANGFVHHYAQMGRSFERDQLGVEGPFLGAQNYRRSITGFSSLSPSRRILWLVPSLFGFLFLFLTCVSLAPVVDG